MGRPKKASKSLEEKMKDANPEFVESVQNLDLGALNNRLAELAKDAESITEAKANDVELEKAKQEASSLGAPYREAKQVVSLKTRYIIKLLKERS